MKHTWQSALEKRRSNEGWGECMHYGPAEGPQCVLGTRGCEVDHHGIAIWNLHERLNKMENNESSSLVG